MSMEAWRDAAQCICPGGSEYSDPKSVKEFNTHFKMTAIEAHKTNVLKDREITRLKAVNEELVRALEECLREHGGFTIKGECEKQARAALAKAKEMK